MKQLKYITNLTYIFENVKDIFEYLLTFRFNLKHSKKPANLLFLQNHNHLISITCNFVLLIF